MGQTRLKEIQENIDKNAIGNSDKYYMMLEEVWSKVLQPDLSIHLFFLSEQRSSKRR